jgi:putative acetyltransferase
MTTAVPLRPFLPADAIGLRELFAASIEELTQDDYDEDQRVAWASLAEDGAGFARRLGAMTTLVVEIEGEHAGFASLRDNKHLEMLYVHPYYAGQGIGAALADAMERIASGRGVTRITVDASDTAEAFFLNRGYVATQRNTREVDGEWLTNTTMEKELKPAGGRSAP